MKKQVYKKKRKTNKTKLPFPILVSGLIGSGKSTLAKSLAHYFHAHYISGSIIHHQLAKKALSLKNVQKVEKGFWETTQGKRMMKLRDKNSKFDREVDRRLVLFLHQKPHTVSDGWLMPWLYKGKAIRIWLQASEDARIKRIVVRDGLPYKKVKPFIQHRARISYGIYERLYHVKLGEDLSPFDLVLNNEGMEPHETFGVVKKYIQMRLHALRK
jgi:cytidylate kinase